MRIKSYLKKGKKMEPNNVLNLWEELKTLMSTVELDVVKNSRGVAAAGVRARRGLRAVKSKVGELIKLTITNDKDKKDKTAPEEPAKSSNVSKRKL